MIARALRQGPVNPVSVYATIWSVLAVLAVLPFSDFLPMRQETWALMFVSFVSLVVGSTQAWLILSALASRRGRQVAAAPTVYSDRGIRALSLVGLGTLVVYVTLQATRPPLLALVRSVGGIGGVLHGAGLEYRYAYVALALRQAESEFQHGGLAAAIVGYALFVPAMLGILLVGHFALRRQWWMVAAPLIVMALYSFVSLERALFIHALLLCLLSYYYHTKVHRLDGLPKTRTSMRGRLAVATALVAVTGITIYLPLKLREPSLTAVGALQSASEYVSGPLGALNAYVINHPHVTPTQLEFGTYSFWGGASVLLRLGAPVHLPPNWLDFVPYQLHGDRLSNVYTWLVYFILDFGWLGVVVIPYLMGLAATALHYLVLMRGRRDLIPPLCVLMAQLVMSFFAFSLLRDLRFWFVMLFAPFIVRRVLRPHFARLDP